MLSILIPCYKYDCFPLAKELHKQCLATGIDFEIICIDDGSHSNHNVSNKQINDLTNSSFSVLDKNIGRSAIRNLLASKAQHEYLLFLDSDVWPSNEDFIQRLIANLNPKGLVYGGVQSNNAIQNKNKNLRWIYRKTRECPPLEERLKNPYYTFASACFLIHKEVFNTVKFNESLTQYGCEDILFAHELNLKEIPIYHIENPIFHNQTEQSSVFLIKTKQALENLKYLTDQNTLPSNIYRITKLHKLISTIRLTPIVSKLFSSFENSLEKNLQSTNPSLFVYDLYRLGYFCKINNRTGA